MEEYKRDIRQIEGTVSGFMSVQTGFCYTSLITSELTSSLDGLTTHTERPVLNTITLICISRKGIKVIGKCDQLS